MISALSPTEIVVASKHSLGTTIEQTVESVTSGLNKASLDKAADKEEQKEKAADATEETESRAHAAVGREWVARTLKKSGKTTEELAKRLWDENVTGVFEVS
jgi:tRNA ligase